MEKNDEWWSCIKVCIALKNKNGGRSSWREETVEKEKKVGKKVIEEIERKKFFTTRRSTIFSFSAQKKRKSTIELNSFYKCV